MINCSTCSKFDGYKCEHFGRLSSMHLCPYAEERKPKTNGDKIRAMSDDELAEYLCKSVREGVALVFPLAHYSKKDIAELNADWLEWLKQEVEE